MGRAPSPDQQIFLTRAQMVGSVLSQVSTHTNMTIPKMTNPIIIPPPLILDLVIGRPSGTPDPNIG